MDPGQAVRDDRLAQGRARRYEITTFRAEAYHPDSRKPDVEFADDIEADLSRRDFTVNAMALSLPGLRRWSTRSAGSADLAAKRLRTPLDPAVSFTDDPLRMLRAARFIAGYELEPEPALVAAVERARTTGWRSSRPSGSATSSTS